MRMSSRLDTDPRAARAASALTLALLVLSGLLVAGVLAGGAAAEQTDGSSHASHASYAPVLQDGGANVSEEAAEVAVPEDGDPFFEEAADDGSWVSYINPRDEYRDPYLGEGSGKVCVTLLNEAGEPIVGESVPNTTATIETDDALEWHEHAAPFAVEFPLTDNYDRPLDSDQFGTSPDYPQGDGSLDAHCLEWHGLPENETVEYGDVELEGEHADEIEVVGYVQQAHEAWDTDVDPIDAAEPYEEAGGWTYEPDGSHGQAVVVLQLEGGAADGGGDGSDGTAAAAGDGGGDDADWVRLGGVIAALVALAALVVGWVRYRR